MWLLACSPMDSPTPCVCRQHSLNSRSILKGRGWENGEEESIGRDQEEWKEGFCLDVVTLYCQSLRWDIFKKEALHTLVRRIKCARNNCKGGGNHEGLSRWEHCQPSVGSSFGSYVSEVEFLPKVLPLPREAHNQELSFSDIKVFWLA